MNRVLVVAPHPDDESLGCGGTLLKHKHRGDELHWLIFTDMAASGQYSEGEISQRAEQVKLVAARYDFKTVSHLHFPPAQLDHLPKSELVAEATSVVQNIQPQIIYLPYRNDVHSDHEVVFDICVAATKQFRLPCVNEILAYETISETDFSLKPNTMFNPNYFVDINEYLQEKLDIVSIYASELGEFPFPRSLEAIEAMAKYRGVQANSKAAEAFMLLKKVC
jgi:LmbE family N-acetylglucosaminyl deacetylase